MTSANETNVTVERLGQVLLIGIHRPATQNRIDPATFAALGRAYFDFEHDAELRVAVLFGHGDHFSAGLDAPSFAPLLLSGGFRLDAPGTINPLGTSRPRLTKPLVAVAHGNTFFMGHELFLAADVRVAAAGTVFSQGEASRGLYPGGGATLRFVREAGWAQAMRYMLTGDSWSAEDAKRMSLISEIAPTPAAARELAIALAAKIASLPPLSTQATIGSARQAIEDGEAEALGALIPTFTRLMKTDDFQERVRATQEQREPIYRGR
jgi:enoyl-CoA hydratase/carnithine racemase